MKVGRRSWALFCTVRKTGHVTGVIKVVQSKKIVVWMRVHAERLIAMQFKIWQGPHQCDLGNAADIQHYQGAKACMSSKHP